MSNIDICVGKVLSLKKAAEKSVYNVTPSNIDRYLSRFIKEISNNSKNFYGPIIVCFKKHDVNKIMKFMIQCRNEQNISETLDKVEDYKSKECIYTRFNGKIEELNFVFQKMEVYAYENEILLDGTIFLVFLKNEGTKYTIDVFSQIQRV